MKMSIEEQGNSAE